MGTYRLSELINLPALQRMADANYKASGMPIGIIDAVDGSILVGTGWQDICVKFHRANPASRKRCHASDTHIKHHLVKGEACHYKCQNGLWDIGIPIIVDERHLATLFFGQFLYEGETPDRNFFIRQADGFGYNLDDYLAALDRVPVFNREKVDHIIQYNIALADFIADLSTNAISRKNTESALLKSEEKYRRLTENAKDMIYRMSLPEGNYEHVNPASTDLFGYTPDEFYRSPLLIQEVIHPDWKNYFKEQWTRLLDGVVPLSYEYQIIHRSGETRWMFQRNVLIRDENGCPVALEGIVTDITDRKLAEEALIRSESFLNTLIDAIPIAVFYKDREGRYLGFNRAFETFFGKTKDQLIGKTVFDINPAALAEIYSAEDDELFKNGKIQQYESQVKNAKGLIRDVIFNKAPFNDNHGVINGLIGTIHDITERKQIEETLRETGSKLMDAQKMAQLGFWVWDITTGAVEWSDEIYNIFQLDPDEFTPHIDAIQALSPWPEEHQRDKELIHRLSMIHEPGSYEQKFLLPDGSIGYYYSTFQGIYDDPGNLIAIKGTVQNITDKKQAEAEQKKMEEQLRQAQKMEAIGRLAGGVAHDFNNMLSIILGNAEIVLEDMDKANPLTSNLKEIYKAANRSTKLTRQLLAFARKQTIEPKILNLNKVLGDMLNMLQRLIGEDIDIAWRPAKKIRPVKIDPSQIDQLLVNLCINARDAITGVGKVTIETDNIVFNADYCRNHAGFIPGNFVMIAVSDNGSGIDEETLENLFEPFFTTKDVGQGSGLGLATVYGIVKQNNGFINVYSEPSEGSTFKIYFPVHMETVVYDHNKDSKGPPPRGNETILLVEDEKAILRMTQIMLERLGYTVLTASTPIEAIRIVEDSNFNEIHLLMTDVVMPEMNGRELSKKILSLYPELKCLFMSGYTANVIAHHGVLDKGIQFINKPFSRQDLGTKLRQILDES